MKSIFYATILFIAVLLSCKNADDSPKTSPQENQHNSHDTLMNNQETDSSDHDDSWKEKQIGTEEATLLKVFSNEGQELDDSELEMLGINTDQNFPLTPETKKVIEFAYCSVFVTYMFGGATDLYNQHAFFVSHFDIMGNLTKSNEFVLLDDIAFEKVSANFLGFSSTYDEYVSGELVMEATGNEITEYKFFYCTEDEMIDLENMSKEQLKLCRNEVYAYYGYKFKDEKLKKHFQKFKWYKPEYENVDDQLTQLEKDLVAYIRNLEDKS